MKIANLILMAMVLGLSTVSCKLGTAASSGLSGDTPSSILGEQLANIESQKSQDLSNPFLNQEERASIELSAQNEKSRVIADFNEANSSQNTNGSTYSTSGGSFLIPGEVHVDSNSNGLSVAVAQLRGICQFEGGYYNTVTGRCEDNNTIAGTAVVDSSHMFAGSYEPIKNPVNQLAAYSSESFIPSTRYTLPSNKQRTVACQTGFTYNEYFRACAQLQK